jgi:aminopeptidase N
LKFFSDYIAPYPFEKLANVQSKTMFGGMENASAIFYNETSVTGKGGIEDLLAHEIAHQWFGDMASEKSFPHLWLSEGFATYLTDIYLEQKQGKQVFVDRMVEERKQVLDFVKHNDHPVVDSLSPYMDLLNANSYYKGGWVLHMLRTEVGDKTFQKIIQTYYQEYKGGNATTKDFEAVAEKVSGEELTWFFDQWLYRPGVPVLQMETKLQDKEFFLYVKQKGEVYRLNLEISIVEEDGETTKERFLITEKDATFKVPVKSSKISFSIDPDVKLLYVLKD